MKNLSCVLFTFLWVNLFAQNTLEHEIEWGEDVSIISSNHKSLGILNDYFVFSSHSVKDYFQFFDRSNLSLNDEIEIERKIDGKKITILQSFIFNNKLSVLSTIIDKKKQGYFLSLVNMNGKIEKSTLLAETDYFKTKCHETHDF